MRLVPAEAAAAIVAGGREGAEGDAAGALRSQGAKVAAMLAASHGEPVMAKVCVRACLCVCVFGLGGLLVAEWAGSAGEGACASSCSPPSRAHQLGWVQPACLSPCHDL